MHDRDRSSPQTTTPSERSRRLLSCPAFHPIALNFIHRSPSFVGRRGAVLRRDALRASQTLRPNRRWHSSRNRPSKSWLVCTIVSSVLLPRSSNVTVMRVFTGGQPGRSSTPIVTRPLLWDDFFERSADDDDGTARRYASRAGTGRRAGGRPHRVIPSSRADPTSARRGPDQSTLSRRGNAGRRARG